MNEYINQVNNFFITELKKRDPGEGHEKDKVGEYI